ncbi:MAG TPA: HU family DNA-binding protein [Thermoanaerobaculia bacterium]|jgi:DNA-binding protein HU-beta|nr:HU family DNA-binding protein [Thermoanaerobaculia bacterium]
MIKNDIVNSVAEAAGVPRLKATQAVETIIEVMRQALARGERIELRGFGVFLVKPRKKGVGRNPKKPTEEVQIPPGFTIRFKPGKELRDMNGAPSTPMAPEPAASTTPSGS